MRAQHIPDEIIAVLGQELEQEILEWRRECLIAGLSGKRDVET